MKELTEQLAAVGAEIAEEDQIVTLLGSLPASYDTIVTVLEIKIDDISLEFVQQALINALSVTNGSTPYERWYGKKPDVGHKKVFGCLAYAHVPDASRQKLDMKSLKNFNAFVLF
ncbi:uncharacterized protein LOC143245472 [Tachypleus tridentatus]|uniref:uncharacterized protein LOC143245472 n=1 Tax=Tachypleus tridentatus TaxID=6853 RepID=UPI003FD13074